MSDADEVEPAPNSTYFRPSRDDGRSDRQVVLDLVGDAEPEATFSFDDLAAALQQGVTVKVAKPRIYTAVTSANKILLRERRRYLKVVRGVGYRVIRAEEHLPVALDRKASALSQLERGVELLKNVHLDELPQPQRAMHEGQLMIMAGLHSAIVSSEQRHARTEAVIDEIKATQSAEIQELRDRLDAIEAQTD